MSECDRGVSQVVSACTGAQPREIVRVIVDEFRNLRVQVWMLAKIAREFGNDQSTS